MVVEMRLLRMPLLPLSDAALLLLLAA